jgi:hypothetical protein
MPTPRRQIRIFISYAHSSSVTAQQLIASLKEYMGPSKNFEYHFWQDMDLKVAERWDEKIKKELEVCDCGILLVSAAFLNSKYIAETEMASLMSGGKLIFPVLLSKVNFEHHNLVGLQEYQIFRYVDEAFSAPRSYGEMRGPRKVDFVDRLFAQMEGRILDFTKK